MTMYIQRWLNACNIRPLVTLRSKARLPSYLRDRRKFRHLAGDLADWTFHASYPCLRDHLDAAGTASGHYFHQDLFVAQCIFKRNPKRHFDVGSRVDGFVAHVAAFREIEYFDIRPITAQVANIVFRQGDLLDGSTLPQCGCDSLSALHVIEHVGLGRYGDRIAPDGWRLALENLSRMLDQGGILYLSVPIGHQRIEFNAHRVFAPESIVGAAQELGLKLERFAWVDDNGAFHSPMDHSNPVPAALATLHYGCGVFEFRQLR
jgi:hypothetical protein